MLTIALATVPTMIAVLVGILVNNARLSDLRSYMDARFNAVDRRFDGVDQRFEEMKDLWRTELRRVEEVLDARLKHLEARSPALLRAASALLPTPGLDTVSR
jgi:hypothetical protein